MLISKKRAFLFIFANFLHFLPDYFQFCALFCSFLRIFDHFFLAHITHTLHLAMPTPIFQRKTTIPPKITPNFSQKKPFF
jgi:hypothetical protein